MNTQLFYTPDFESDLERITPKPNVVDKFGLVTRPARELESVNALLEPSIGDNLKFIRATPWAAWPPLAEGLFLDFADVNQSTTSRIASCEEYIYERFYDLHRFENEAHGLEGNWEAIYDLAYGPLSSPAAIGTRMLSTEVLRRRNGSDSHSLILQRISKRSPFLMMGSHARLALKDHPVANPLLAVSLWQPGEPLERIGQISTNYYNIVKNAGYEAMTWEWHKERHDELVGAGFTVDEMLSYEPFKQRFRTLAWQLENFSQIGPPLDFDQFTINENCNVVEDNCGLFENSQPSQFIFTTPLNGELTENQQQWYAERSILATKVVEALQVARELGCLKIDEPHPCQWSPREFARSVFAVETPDRHATLERCYEWTGTVDDWGTLSNYTFNVVEGMDPHPANKNYLLHSERLEEYFADKRAWIENIVELIEDLNLDTDVSGRPRIGKTFIEERADGGEYFSFDYDMSSSWDIVNLEGADPNNPKDKQVDVRFRGRFAAEAEIFERWTVPPASMDIKLAGTGSGNPPTSDPSSLVITLAGFEVQNFMWSGQPSRWNLYSGEDSRDDETTIEGPIFFVAGIPLRVSGGLAGEIGYTLDIDVTAGTQLHLDADFIPRASVAGFVTVAVDYGIAKAGIKGQLTLLRVELPVRMDLTLDLTLDLNLPGGKPKVVST
ncbi:MAG: hypothetical protein ACI9OJ_000227, partial [Myxococcota bacterium]